MMQKIMIGLIISGWAMQHPPQGGGTGGDGDDHQGNPSLNPNDGTAGDGDEHQGDPIPDTSRDEDQRADEQHRDQGRICGWDQGGRNQGGRDQGG